MGQMHLHYALSHEPPPAQVAVVDRHPERLELCVRGASRLPKRVGSNCSFIAMPKPASTSKNLR